VNWPSVQFGAAKVISHGIEFGNLLGGSFELHLDGPYMFVVWIVHGRNVVIVCA